MERLKLKVVSPCPVDSPQTRGAAYCDHCDKTVFDFTDATETEVRAHYLLFGGELCATITPDRDGEAILRASENVSSVGQRRFIARRDVAALSLTAALGGACGAAPAPTTAPVVKSEAGTTRETPVDADRDGDGIVDARDQCPDEKEDHDNFQDEDGCLDPDNDGDRIADADDQCPNEPEAYNGYDDEDGCYDQGVQGGIGRNDGLHISEKIGFIKNSAALSADARALLDAVAEILADNAHVHLVEVEGHADETERREEVISKKRAKKVADYLIRKGVSAARLRVVGYGERHPLDRRSNPRAWEKNRRVSFSIIEQSAPGDTSCPAPKADG